MQRLHVDVNKAGAVATELPENSTDSEAAEQMRTFYDGVAIPADSFARAVAFAMSQPDDVDVNEILFRADASGAVTWRPSIKEVM